MFRMRFLILMILSSLFFNSFAAFSVASQNEDVLLWEQGRTHFLKTEWKKSIYSFEKILTRFPNSPHANEAMFFLSQSYQKINENKKSIEVLKKYILRNTAQPEGFKARLLLAQFYLDLKMFAEASLLSQEIIQHYQRTPLNKEFFLEALLLKAQAEIGIQNFEKALVSLQAFKSQKGLESHTIFDPIAHQIELDLKKNDCETLYQKKPKDEGQWLAQMKEVSLCYAELLSIYGNSLKHYNNFWIKKSSNWMETAFQELHKKCTTPQIPAQLKLNENQKKEYSKDTLPLIQKKCQETYQEMQITLQNFNQKYFQNEQEAIAKIIQKLKIFILEL